MVKRERNSIWIFLMIFSLIALGIFFVSIKPKFTGFVTNTITGSASFSAGVFQGTKFDSQENAIVLDNATSGSYTSQIFGTGEDVNWNNMTYIADSPPNSSIVFYARTCDDAACDTESFAVLQSQNLSLLAKYFQYKAEMQTSGNSPKLYEVNIIYSQIQVPVNLFINIESPQATTYTTDSILVKITSNALNVWFNIDSGTTEAYTGEVTKTFSEGTHILNVFVNDSNGNQNSSSVNFSVDLPEPVVCGNGNIETGETCDDSNTDDGDGCSSSCIIEEAEEEAEETTTPTEETSEVQESVITEETSEVQESVITGETVQTVCVPDWQCGEWSECVNLEQTRTCSDANACGTEDGKPALSQSCTPPESCSDGMKNQDEIGIDCGGSCENRCPFFTIVGSAVKGLPDRGKQFLQFFKEKIFVNKKRTFLILGGIGIVIIGFVAFRILKKKGFSLKITRIKK